MKEFKYEKEHLNYNDLIAGTITILLAKGIITEQELEESVEAILIAKNKKLAKEREKSPGAMMLFDMMMDIKKS